MQTLAARFEVRAVCDPIAHRAEQTAKELGARSIDGFRNLAAAEDVDALMILSARWFGALPIFAACDYGKAVYCGASVDINTMQADELRDRVRDSGIAFMAEFPNRLAPATIRLQELIATKLGAPKLLFCNQRHTAEHCNLATQDISMRHLVEMVDWCRYVTGREVVAVTGSSHVPVEVPSEASVNTADAGDYTVLTLDFSDPGSPGSGPMAQIAHGSYVPPELTEAAAFRRAADMQIICENGIAFVDLPSSLVWFDKAGQHHESLDNERPVGEQLLMQFHRSVSSLVLKSASLEDGYRAMSLVIAARRSHLEGQRIAIDHGPMPSY